MMLTSFTGEKKKVPLKFEGTTLLPANQELSISKVKTTVDLSRPVPITVKQTDWNLHVLNPCPFKCSPLRLRRLISKNNRKISKSLDLVELIR